MFYANILKSQSFGTHYYGSTEDLNKRLVDHNSGKVKYQKQKALVSTLF
jgi:predicted GIY-YIG superfamily endonuclease